MPSVVSLSLSKPNILKARSPATTTVYVPDNLNEKFSRKGIKFWQSDNIPMVELTVKEWLFLKATEPGSKGSLMPAEWTVKDVDSDAIEALQVEPSCTSGVLDLIYVVTLHPQSKVFEAVLTAHTYKPEKKPGLWTSQDVSFTILKNKLSRVYAAPPKAILKAFYDKPPSKYETLDQVIRMGFEDIYLSSPGSFSEKYGKEYFICTGPTSMLVPLVVKPGEDWRGAHVIEHDNL
ncbi:hypothetical protein FEM48_Zijuj12G0136000 [Ziziphus jujuba var. spinosa]|uniref:Photosynthetic NDH subunit of subcomplex B 2, chloroplastic n=1 Tax=Ziziphus jujuba var. spinosa TaxID=714518 RepID=A0A978UDM6_ZIZJJ|nr:hypothetical protein FEM48_Zijuj12G0136000 [Ziziphus jujuba var. spinosa]